MPYLRKYNAATHILIPITKRAVVDYAVSADWTPAAGDVKITKDEGAAANVSNLPTALTMGNTALWDFSLTATELQAARVRVTIADAATKAVEDDAFDIDTYGNASAQHAIDLSDAVRAGLTALPNAAAEAAGGLYTRGTGVGQIRQDANGRIDANTKAWIDGAIPAVNVTGVPKVDLVDWLGSAPDALSSGKIPADLKLWLTSAPDALSSGKVPADVKLWLAVAMNALISGRVDANAQVVGDKTGYSLSQAFPTNFSTLAIDGSGRVDLSKVLGSAINALIGGRVDSNAQVVGDKTGYALTSGEETAIADALLKRDMSAVTGEAARSPLNAFRLLRNLWQIVGGTLTVMKEDDTTTAWTGAVTTTAGDPVSKVDPA